MYSCPGLPFHRFFEPFGARDDDLFTPCREELDRRLYLRPHTAGREMALPVIGPHLFIPHSPQTLLSGSSIVEVYHVHGGEIYEDFGADIAGKQARCEVLVNYRVRALEGAVWKFRHRHASSS